MLSLTPPFMELLDSSNMDITAHNNGLGPREIHTEWLPMQPFPPLSGWGRCAGAFAEPHPKEIVSFFTS